MKIKLESGVEYWVSWKHENHFNEDEVNKSTLYSFTECRIENKTYPQLSRVSTAIVGRNEKFFNKDKGRKVSLKRTMGTIGLNKETRTLFWNEYHKLTNKPQRIKWKN